MQLVRRRQSVCLPFDLEFVGGNARHADALLAFLEEDAVHEAGDTIVKRALDEAGDALHLKFSIGNIGNRHTVPAAIGKHVDEPRNVAADIDFVIDDDWLLAFRMDPVASVIGKAHALEHSTQSPKPEPIWGDGLRKPGDDLQKLNETPKLRAWVKTLVFKVSPLSIKTLSTKL